METRTITLEQIESYGKTLRLEERCEATAQKYVGAATAFFDFLPEGKIVTRELALAWKAEISAKNAAARSTSCSRRSTAFSRSWHGTTSV